MRPERLAPPAELFRGDEEDGVADGVERRMLVEETVARE